MSCSQFSILGTPMGSLDLLNSTIEVKTQRLQLMAKRLSGLRSQDALCLLCHLFAIHKALFILRSAPYFLSKYWRHLTGCFNPSYQAFSTSILTMMDPGCKPHFQYMLEFLGFVEQFSWYLLYFWPPLLDAHH